MLASGLAMREKRLAAGLTLQAVGDAMGGKSRAYIHALETGYGKHPPRWTAEMTRRYEAALEKARAGRSGAPGGVQSTTTWQP